jgi:integrase
VSTNAGYSSAIRFWKAAVCDRRGVKLGDRPVRILKHSDVLTALASRPDLTGKTVNNYVSVLRKAMELAVADKTISTNPVSAVARAKHQKPLPDPFSREEAESIVADMAAHYQAPIANYAEFKFFTGLRTSESFGLHWRDVDLAGKHLARAPRDRPRRREAQHQDQHRAPGDPQQPGPRSDPAPAQAHPDARRACLSRPTLRGALVRGARLPAQLLGADVAAPGAALPPALQHPPHVRDHDAHGRHDASLLREAARSLGGDVLSHPCAPKQMVDGIGKPSATHDGRMPRRLVDDSAVKVIVPRSAQGSYAS